jgi:hypothetical protein
MIPGHTGIQSLKKRLVQSKNDQMVLKDMVILIIFRKPPAMPVRLEKAMPCRA